MFKRLSLKLNFVKNRFTLISLLVLFFPLLFSSCKKINESTTLGDDVIPGVDGITTFDTTLAVEAFNELFTATNDSLGIGRNDLHILGNIQDDPLFGKTNAKIFLELKPPFYKFTFADKPDSLEIDSVVLVLGWRGNYGDTNAMQRIRVYEIDPSNEFRTDSFYQVRQEYFTYSSLLGSKDVFPYQLNDSIKVFEDSSSNQLRIRLSDSFGDRLLNYDSTNAYATDSAFKTYFKGFAIEADGTMGNGLMAFGLSNEPSTKLAIYYRYNNNGQYDSTVSYFQFTFSSAHQNYIKRDFTGTPLLAAQGGSTPDDLIYLLNAPGSYATLKIPGLKNLNNRIIHRAELIVEQVYDVSDKTFGTPGALFIDVYDSSIAAYKCVPYDFVPDQQGINPVNFGMYGKSTTDAFGNSIRKWTFNISRYVQNTVNKKEPAHDFRLVTHRYIFNKIRANNFTNTGPLVDFRADINPLLAFGRVRVGGGNFPGQKMRLRIIYTKI
jgi:uncharacterized protein DUF4270